jgi:glycosyltransferase involved in cell wall biosynthesis
MKMNNHNLVTIGITCFNAADTIERAIKSAFSQTWPKTEVIIVDDCSIDSSVDVIEKSINGHKNSRLIKHNKNRGRADARNTILNNAKGEFIVFYDDDDESFPDRVQEQVETVLLYEKQTGAQYVTCCASGIRCYSNGYNLPMPAIGSQGGVPKGKELADYLLFYKKQPGKYYGGGVPTCALLARRRVFEAVGGFEEGMRSVEDADIAIRLAFLDCHFIGTKKQLFKQYVTFSEDKSPEINLKAEQFLAEKNKDYLRSINKYYYAKQWPKLRYFHFKRQYILFLLVFISLFLRHPFAVFMHFCSTAPRRMLHEQRMKREIVK